MNCFSCSMHFVRGSLALIAMALAAPFAPAQERITTLLYDVSALVFKETSWLPARLGPPEHVGAELDRIPAETISAISSIELPDLVNLLKEATDPRYWEAEGIGISPEESGYLSISCDERMHERVAATLRAMRDLHLEQIIVELHLLDSAILRGRPAILAGDELDALLRHAEPHPVLIERVRLGGVVLLGQGHHVSLVHGIGMEPRERDMATCPDPETGWLRLGSQYRVQTGRASQGRVLVSIGGGDCELIGETKTRPVVAEGQHDTRRTALQLPRFQMGWYQSSALLRDGEGLLYGTSSGRALCLRIRRPRPIGDPFANLPADPTALSVRCHPLRGLCGAGQPGGVRVFNLFPGLETEADPLPAFADESRIHDLLKMQIHPSRWDGSPYTMNSLEGHLLVRAAPDAQAQVADMLASMGKQVARRFGLEIRYGKVDGRALATDLSSNLEALADRLPHSCIGVAGKHGGCTVEASTWTTYIADFDPVVAAEAVASKPIVDRVNDGVRVGIDVVPVSDTQVRLRFVFELSEVTMPKQPFDLGDDRFGKIDLPLVQSHQCSSDPVLDLDRWTLMHVSPVPGGSEHVVVVLRVRDL